jgi:hypothetical protein
MLIACMLSDIFLKEIKSRSRLCKGDDDISKYMDIIKVSSSLHLMQMMKSRNMSIQAENLCVICLALQVN